LDDESLVQVARTGDADAFTSLVERYRNTVYGVAYDQIGDFDRARDVVQEVFIRAYLRLRELRDPKKFAPWLYQMTVNECRMRRRAEGRVTIGLSDRLLERQTVAAPDKMVQERFLLQQALLCLTPDSRRTILLFYFHGSSLQEIATFLDSSVSAVKSRLRDARARLRREMLEMIEETVKAEPLPEGFSQEIVTRLLRASYDGKIEIVRQMLDEDARLATIRGDYSPGATNVSPLLMAAECNWVDIIDLLRQREAFQNLSEKDVSTIMHAAAFHKNRSLVEEMVKLGSHVDLFVASKLGDADLVRDFLQRDPQLVHARDESGGTALHTVGTVEVAEILLDAGAELEAIGVYGDTPAEHLSYPRGRAIVDLFVSRGAHVSFHLACSRNDVVRVNAYLDANPDGINARQGHKRPEGDTLPINIAAVYQAIDVVRLLLDRGADVNTQDEKRGGATPLHFAALHGNLAIVQLLLSRHADATIRANFFDGPAYQNATPLTWAQEGKRDGWGLYDTTLGSGRHDEVIALLK
jgi:RNA polymerase sigma factor (sigma-70 family)